MLFFTIGINCRKNQERDPAEKYYKQIFNYLKYHLNNDSEAAEECAQEVFATYYELLPGLTMSEPKTWLFHTADNFLNRYIREQAIEKRRVISFDDERYSKSVDERLSYEPDFDVFLEKNVDVQENSAKIISALREDEQIIYNQYFKQHIPVRDLAHEYNVSEGSVWAKIHRVKQHILKIIQKMHESEPLDSM